MEEQESNQADLEYLKMYNHKRIRRIVSTVAIALTVLAIVLVALSLSLGSRIDQLVNESLDTSLKISGSELFFGPKINDTDPVQLDNM